MRLWRAGEANPQFVMQAVKKGLPETRGQERTLQSTGGTSSRKFQTIELGPVRLSPLLIMDTNQNYKIPSEQHQCLIE